MKKITEEKEKINELIEKLYNINPDSAGESIRMDMLTINFLELIENYDLMKIAKSISEFIEDNTRKYNFPERCLIIASLISRCNDYFFDNNDLNDIYNKYIEFINTYNSLDENYKIDIPTYLEIDKLHKIQKKLKSDINDINNEYKSIKNKIEKINYDLIGTISLFIGIIFALYSGFELCTSVFEYVGTIEFKYLIIALIILGYIEISVISLLVHVIFKINNKNSKDLLFFNIIAFIIMIVTILLIINFVK